MSDTVTRLSSQDWAILERRIRMDGGAVLGEACSGAEVKDRGGVFSTCACGEHRRVRVPYAPLGAAPAALDGEAVLCANCDGLSRAPRFAYTRTIVE